VAIAVFSTRFLLATHGTGPRTFIVPDGFVAVVRDLDVECDPTTGCDVALAVGGVTIFLEELGVVVHYSYVSWRGRAVCYPLDEIVLNTTDNAQGQVSGYLLVAP
jgi:hypothetical protein